MIAPHSEDRRVIYEQDMESLRHRYSAKWGRFQTASVIEGAALYVGFEGGLSQTESVLAFAMATLLLSLIFILVVIDDSVLRAYETRTCEFEEEAGIRRHSANMRPIPGVKPSKWVIVGVLAFNVAIIARLVFWPQGL